MVRRILLLAFSVLTAVGLSAQSGCLQGTVVEAKTGDPIPFVNITIEANGYVVTGGTTDFDGKFFIKPINPGKYDVQASYIGYATVKRRNVYIAPKNDKNNCSVINFVLMPEEDRVAVVGNKREYNKFKREYNSFNKKNGIEEKLSRYGELKFRVVDDNHEPLLWDTTETGVFVKKNGQDFDDVTYYHGDGTWVIKPIKMGKYDVWASCNGYTADHKKVKVYGGFTCYERFRLHSSLQQFDTISRCGSLVIKVYDKYCYSDNNKLPNPTPFVHVAISKNGREVFYGDANYWGLFSKDFIEEGKYDVQISYSGLKTKTLKVKIRKGKTTFKSVVLKKSNCGKLVGW